MRENEIGVRCGANRNFLWFYPGAHLLRSRSADSTMELDVFNALSVLQSGILTPPGIVIISETMGLDDISSLSLRDTYFSPGLSGPASDESQAAARWEVLLPQIVSIIRRATFQPEARPVLEPTTSGVENWHEELLRRLFG